jgi:ubiquitin C-terminal hydrolase
LHDRSLSMFQSHSFSLGLDNSMNLPIGLNFFPSLLQDYSINLPRTNQTERTHADMLARSDSPHAGLDNSGILCYANAIFQALASMRHLTTLFNVPPPDTVTTYPLNHAFCSLLYSMVLGERNQNTVLNASNFITLFCERNDTFKNRQSKYSYDIVFPIPFETCHSHDKNMSANSYHPHHINQIINL